MKVAVSDIRKTPADTEQRVDDVTNRTSRLEVKHDDTEKKIKDVSSKMTILEQRVLELQNEMTKEKTERSADSEASSEARAALEARIDTVESELKTKIRQVASEHTVFEGRFTMTRQPNAVHVGES